MTESFDLFSLIRQAAGESLRPGPDSREESEHPLQATLYDYAVGTLPDTARQNLEEHLKTCERCRKDVDFLHECIEEAKGIAAFRAPKRAAGEGDVVRTSTADGRFRLTLRPDATDARRGVLTVETEADDDRDRKVLVTDGRRRDLLRGRLVEGRASQRVERIDEIQLDRLVVVAL